MTATKRSHSGSFHPILPRVPFQQEFPRPTDNLQQLPAFHSFRLQKHKRKEGNTRGGGDLLSILSSKYKAFPYQPLLLIPTTPLHPYQEAHCSVAPLLFFHAVPELPLLCRTPEHPLHKICPAIPAITSSNPLPSQPPGHQEVAIEFQCLMDAMLTPSNRLLLLSIQDYSRK